MYRGMITVVAQRGETTKRLSIWDFSLISSAIIVTLVLTTGGDLQGNMWRIFGYLGVCNQDETCVWTAERERTLIDLESVSWCD